MNRKKILEDRIRGWLPTEAYESSFQKQAVSKTRAYVVGYGVGIGVCELLMLTFYWLGWANVERNLSPVMEMLANLVIVLPSVFAAMIIGERLSKKLLERWRAKK
jgi:hypothetical protein